MFLFQSIFYFLLGYIVLVAWNIISLSIIYKKERYEFEGDRIRFYYGGLFSDNQTELVVKNITNVRQILPFWQHLLFGTGKILIQSAGSQTVEVRLRHVKEYKEIVKTIQNQMKQHGFSMSKSELIQHEKPYTLGVISSSAFAAILQLFGSLLITMFFLSGFISMTSAFELKNLLELAEQTSILKNFDWIASLSITSIVIGVVITFFGITLVRMFFSIFLTYFDSLRRDYYVYNDLIEYNEGFLTKEYSFIPLENVADSVTDRSFVARIIGTSDVKISCQGSNVEIVFTNMKNGLEMEANIDKQLEIIRNKQSLEEKKSAQTIQETSSTQTRDYIPYQENQKEQPLQQPFQTIDLKMNPTRVIVPFLFSLPIVLIFLPLLFGYIPVIIGAIIMIAAKTYKIKSSTIGEETNFFSFQSKEFSYSKMTGIFIKQNLFDRWFGTCSIQFWSIGSNESIVFKNINVSEEITSILLQKTGIDISDHNRLKTFSPRFNLVAFFVSNIALWIFFGVITFGFIIGIVFGDQLVFSTLFILALLVQAAIVGLILVFSYLYYNFQKLEVFKTSIYIRSGIPTLFTHHFYTVSNHIKDVISIKYPLTHRGKLQLNIAGESLVNAGESQTTQSNKVSINYIDNVQKKHLILDTIFFNLPHKKDFEELIKKSEAESSQEIMHAQPAMMNSFVTNILICLIIVPLIVLLPFILIYIAIYISRTRYTITKDRVIHRSGIFFITIITISHKKIDHINLSQGMFHKLFGNGTITVHTISSSAPEMTIRDIPNYETFYTELKNRYS